MFGLHVPPRHECKNGLPGQNDDEQGSELFVNMLSELGDGAWPQVPITYGNWVQAPYVLTPFPAQGLFKCKRDADS